MAGTLIHPVSRVGAATPIHHRARATIRLGKRHRLDARIEVTSGGLLAIGGLVSSILLSTAVLVHVAVRDGGKAHNQR
jgi:hypothetical protein